MQTRIAVRIAVASQVTLRCHYDQDQPPTKKVVHISTISTVVVMTSKLRVLRADDVFAENKVLKMRKTQGLEMPLAGACWLLGWVPPGEAHRQALRHATSLVLTKLSGYDLWLLAGHTAWQPRNSRITRYRKLWGSLR
jgi:hypothetical protein